MGIGIGELVILAGIGLGLLIPPLFLLGALAWFVSRRDPAPQPDAAPARPTGAMQVIEMQVRGFLRLDGPDGQVEEPWPDSPRGGGEFPTGVWADAAGRAFCVGKLYSGAPGPDDGAVYQRDPDGTWTLLHRLADRTLHSVAGTDDGLLVAGAMGGVLVRSGGAWRFVELPYPMVVKVWPDGGHVHAQAFDGSAAWAFLDGFEPVEVAPQPLPERRLETFARDGVTYTVFDRSWEVGERELDGDEAAELKADFAALQQALADSSAEVREPFDPDR